MTSFWRYNDAIITSYVQRVYFVLCQLSQSGLLPMQGPAAMALDSDIFLHEYDIHVYTGFRNQAQTRSNVSLRIWGTDGCSQILHLGNADKKVSNEAPSVDQSYLKISCFKSKVSNCV